MNVPRALVALVFALVLVGAACQPGQVPDFNDAATNPGQYPRPDTNGPLLPQLIDEGLQCLDPDGHLVDCYRVYSPTWTDADVTYDDPRVARAVQEWAAVSRLRDGGLAPTSSADIRVTFPDPWPYGSSVLGAASWSPGGPCRLQIRPDQATAAEIFHPVILHEVGHCHGIGHSERATAVMYAYCCNAPLSADDIDAVRALYGVDPNDPPLTPTPAPSPSPTRSSTPVPTPTPPGPTSPPTVGITPTPSTTPRVYRVPVGPVARD